jgi:aspartyl-tRNA(Asn)/glutamyl-tRNA(Gln) amidotransferase subunit C
MAYPSMSPKCLPQPLLADAALLPKAGSRSSKKRCGSESSAIFVGFGMEVTDALIDKLSNLARLSFSASEKAAIREDLARLIGFVDQLNQVDTTGVAPLVHMSDAVNRFREDAPGGQVDRSTALASAKDASGSFFTVPKVIQKQTTGPAVPAPTN